MSVKNPARNFIENFKPRTGAVVDLKDILEFYAEHLLREADAYFFPVDLDKVFVRYSLRVKGGFLPGQRALLTPEFDILYNSGDRETVQTFSKAHELIEALIMAVLEFDPQWISEAQIEDLLNQKEDYCEYGASMILMPMKLFKPYLEEYGYSMRTALDLARSSGLSLTAIARQMLKTRLRKAAFVVWHFAHKPSEFATDQDILPGFESAMSLPKKLRVERVYRSPTVSQHIPYQKSIEDTTAIAQAFQARGGTITTGHDSLKITGFPDRYLTESIPAAYDGQPRVMSFIYFDDYIENA